MKKPAMTMLFIVMAIANPYLLLIAGTAAFVFSYAERFRKCMKRR